MGGEWSPTTQGLLTPSRVPHEQLGLTRVDGPMSTDVGPSQDPETGPWSREIPSSHISLTGYWNVQLRSVSTIQVFGDQYSGKEIG